MLALPGAAKRKAAGELSCLRTDGACHFLRQRSDPLKTTAKKGGQLKATKRRGTLKKDTHSEKEHPGVVTAGFELGIWNFRELGAFKLSYANGTFGRNFCVADTS